MTSLNVAEVKANFSVLLRRARDGETLLITRRGTPMARLVPPEESEELHLADVEGWLEDDDPFFEAMEDLVKQRSRRAPRALANDPFRKGSND